MIVINLLTKEVEDTYSRENFKRLNEYINLDSLAQSRFKHFETLLQAGTNKFKHNLGYQPKDVLLTFVSAGASVAFTYDNFTVDFIEIVSNVACTVRFLAGAYQEN